MVLCMDLGTQTWPRYCEDLCVFKSMLLSHVVQKSQPELTHTMIGSNTYPNTLFFSCGNRTKFCVGLENSENFFLKHVAE